MIQNQTDPTVLRARRRRLFFMTLSAVAIVGLVGVLVAALMVNQAAAAPVGPTWPSLLPDSGCNYSANLTANYTIKTSMSLPEAAAGYAERLADQGWSVDVKKAASGDYELDARLAAEQMQIKLTLSDSKIQAEVVGHTQCP